MPRAVTDDFTITLVFRSTTTSGGGGGWYNSGGLVDGEVSGVVNDFGISLDGSGQLLSGTGNPDTTIDGNGGFNDGQPHYVTFTRTEATRALAQYVDSALQGTATAGTQALNSPPRLTIGATQSGAGYYYGDIAEILILQQGSHHRGTGRRRGLFGRQIWHLQPGCHMADHLQHRCAGRDHAQPLDQGRGR